MKTNFLSGLLLGLSLCAAAMTASAAPPTPRISVVNEEVVGPFASWGNVMDYGAVGDGVADDTDALQRALDDTNHFYTNNENWQLEQPGSPSVIYLPPGTYRITRTLTQKDRYGVSLIGADASQTRIVWTGPAQGAMLIADGVFGGKYARITWDGQGSAGIGVAHWWHQATGQYGGSVEHTDEVFTDMGVGIVAGCCGNSSTPQTHPPGDWQPADYGSLDSEGMVRRTKFIRMSEAGVSTESYNALDWWISDSEFYDCRRGLTNALGAGNFLAYRNLFVRSTLADIHVATPQWHSMHDNTSIGSWRFFLADKASENGGPMILKNNHIIDSTETNTILLGNLGPLIMIDNEIRSLPDATGPVVQYDNYTLGSAFGYDLIAVGNKFTSATPFTALGAHDRGILIDNQIVDADSISTAQPAPITARQPEQRQVFEVPFTPDPDNASNITTSAMIQAVIDAAAQSDDANPIVHFPRNTYLLDATLVVPAGRRMQLVGDSIATMLKASDHLGNVPLLRLQGPSLATVRDLRLYSYGDTRTALEIDNANQDGARVLINGNIGGNMQVTDLPLARVEAQSNSGFKGIRASNAGSIVTLGTGNIGPTFINANSKLMFNDTWFENYKDNPLVQGDSGDFSYLGGHIAPPEVNRADAPAGASIRVNNFAGNFSMIGFSFNMNTPGQGIRIGQELPDTKAMFLGVTGDVEAPYYKRTGSGGTVGFAMMKKGVISVTQVPDSGTTTPDAIRDALALVRSLAWDSEPTEPPDGATNVLLHRLMTVETAVGYNIKGN